MDRVGWTAQAFVPLPQTVPGNRNHGVADDKSNQQLDLQQQKQQQQQQQQIPEKKKWIHDPSSDLCKPLNCKKKELCLLEDAYTAVCVSKKELHKNK
ncbi:hypothetical protein CpipJ_CPIJ011903 [Culex quinquefasciatus]|uniref:Uncharacterized protein n=1 Tax=Culex quinquefasciatus TaxID=7176 RepID=B0WXI0_CULQU|nr:hypothetical protein CpipJ_CPIJ011903 [Culex quinquefasciatus]|eukprot:XP_001862102.1 hypothetical protein CpipJ_CPIJ011903 [Culex quinquefasciatus]